MSQGSLPFRPEMTVSAARAEVMAHRNEPAGIECPVCTRLCKVYRRKLNASMAIVLIHLTRRQRTIANGVDNWVHVPSFISALPFSPRVLAAIRGDWAKLKYWGFIDQVLGERPDGSKRNGYYQVTPGGMAFARGGQTAPAFIYMTNGRVLGYSDERVDIVQALGKRFDYRALMSEGGLQP